jgi:hypothetical protein
MVKTSKPKHEKLRGVVSNEAQQALVRGNGRALVATHGFGCKHYGIRDMPIMDTTQDYKHYIQPGFWLHGKCCVDCKTEATDLKPNRVVNGFIMNYCRMGVSCEQLDPQESEEMKQDYESRECDFIVCLTCKNKRLEAFELDDKTNNDGARQSRSKRTGNRN